MKQIHLLLALITLSFLGCSKTTPLRVEWQLITNDVEPDILECQYTLTNTSGSVLKGGEINEDGSFEPYWQLFYNQLWGRCISPQDAPLRDTLIENYTYYSLIPTASFPDLAPGDSLVVRLRYKGRILRLSHYPEGMFIVFRSHAPKGVKTGAATDINFVLSPITSWDPHLRHVPNNDTVPYANGEYMYRDNNRFTPLPAEPVNLLPMVKAVRPIQPVSVDTIPEEGYIININEDGEPTILSRTETGHFYAEQTLTYLTNLTSLAGWQIYDYPDFQYRGFSLDIARNFPGKEMIYHTLDAMAQLKLNRFQIHLTDNEGWRIEIPELPELTKRGSRRGYEGTAQNPLYQHNLLYPQFGGGQKGSQPSNMANGYLTQKDFIDILRYAKARHITVIPEVDMPAHSRAARRASAPKMHNPVMDTRPMPRPEFRNDILAVMNSETLDYAETIISSIQNMYKQADCELHYFHIGGDEVPVGILTDQERRDFMDSLIVILKRHNLHPVGWEELTPFCRAKDKPMISVWHPNYPLLQQLVDSGYPLIQMREDRLYFDFCYCNHPQEQGTTRGSIYTSEECIFDWTPTTSFVGIQGAMWGEFIRSNTQLEKYIYPKMFALAERAWNYQSTISLNRFNDLTYSYLVPRWIKQEYTVHLPLPGIHLEQGQVIMNSRVNNGQIHYTLDGTEPTPQDALYEGPFLLTTDPALIRARLFYLNQYSNTSRL